MEITLGNTSSSANDSSNDTVNCVVKTKNAVQVDVENKELTISPQNKTKISDKIIRILNNSDEVASSTDQNKEMTQTDLLLKEYTSQKETVSDAQITENKSNDGRKNLLEDTQVDEANINSMILNKKTTEKDSVSLIRKGKKRSVGSTEINEPSQSKALKLTNHLLQMRHNVTINEANDMGNKDTEDDFSETDPLALVEVKTEPYSDDEVITVTAPTTTQSLAAAKKTKEPSRAIDNLTKVINAVAAGATNATAILKTSTTTANLLKPPQTPAKKCYNKARKSFPASKNFEIQTPATTVTFSIQPPQLISPAPPLVRIGGETHTAPSNLPPPRLIAPHIELKESQNYIPLPQNPSPSSVPQTSTTSTTTTTSATPTQATTANGTATNACLTGIMEEFRTLGDTLPAAAAKAVSELICRPPPKLKPRPPSALSDGFEECIPSTAGHITSKLNTLAYRVSYFVYESGIINSKLQKKTL